MFNLPYTNIYFFIINFFPNVYISVNTIFECSYLFFGWEISHPLSTYASRGMEKGSCKMCTRGERGGGWKISHKICVY